MRRDIFNKAALERLSTPEQLDTLMRVTQPAGWVALATTAVVLGGVVAWSILGDLRVTVPARGILIRGGALIDIQAGSNGRILKFLVKPGDVVNPGDAVAEIAQREMVEETNNLSSKIADLENQDVRQTAAEAEVRRSTLEAWDAEEKQLGTQVKELNAQIVSQRRQVDIKEEALKKGFGTGFAVQDEKDKLGSILRLEKDLTQRMKDIPSKRESFVSLMDKDQGNRRTEIAEFKRRLETGKRALTSASQVRAHAGGRALERAADVGDLVTPQSRVLSLEPLDVPLLAILYVPAGEGKSISEGFEVHLSPSTVQREEYGVMIGRVRSVSTYPATPEGMLRTLRNQALVTLLSAQGAPLEVVAELVPDPKTVSGYKWSSPGGPPLGIFGGTMCTASIVTETRKPISYVIPFMKKSLGVE